MRTASLSGGSTDVSLAPAASSVDRVLHFNHHIQSYDEFDISFFKNSFKALFMFWELHQFVIVK